MFWISDKEYLNLLFQNYSCTHSTTITGFEERAKNNYNSIQFCVALGTWAAVIVSLILANRKQKPLYITGESIDDKHIEYSKNDPDVPKFLQLTLCNTSDIPAKFFTKNGLLFKVPIFFNGIPIQKIYRFYEVKIPTIVADEKIFGVFSLRNFN